MAAQFRAMPREFNGSLIVEGDPPFGVGGVDSGRQGLKQGPEGLISRVQGCLGLLAFDAVVSTVKASMTSPKSSRLCSPTSRSKSSVEERKLRSMYGHVLARRLTEGPGRRAGGRTLKARL